MPKTKTPDPPTPKAEEKDPGEALTPTGAEAPMIRVDEDVFDSKTHACMVLGMKASGRPVSLVMSDLANLAPKAGKKGSPVFLTDKFALELEKLTKFLDNKGVTLPDPVKEMLKSTEISLDAFYFAKKDLKCTEANKNALMEMGFENPTAGKSYSVGPLLLSTAIRFKDKGPMEALTGDKDLGELFDVESVWLQVVRCSKEDTADLKKYIGSLSHSGDGDTTSAKA